MPARAILDPLRQALAGRADVRLALLFGSHARGADREGSDVDVAVDAPGADRLTLAAELSAALEADVQVVDLLAASVPLLEELVRDALVVHEGRPGAAADWRAWALTELETDRPWYARMRDAWLARVAAKGL